MFTAASHQLLLIVYALRQRGHCHPAAHIRTCRRLSPRPPPAGTRRGLPRYRCGCSARVPATPGATASLSRCSSSSLPWPRWPSCIARGRGLTSTTLPGFSCLRRCRPDPAGVFYPRPPVERRAASARRAVTAQHTLCPATGRLQSGWGGATRAGVRSAQRRPPRPAPGTNGNAASWITPPTTHAAGMETARESSRAPPDRRPRRRP